MARVEIPITVDKLVSGNWEPANGASVQINLRGGGSATLYSAASGGTTVANPVTTDANGRFTAYAEEGSYDAVISGAGISTYTVEFELVSANALVTIGTTRIQNAAVTDVKLASNAVTTSKILNGAVTAAKLAADVAQVPTGAVFAWSTAVAPDGYLMADGAQYTVGAQTALYNVIGTTYGGTAGVNFKVPDLRGRVPVGPNSSSGRLSTNNTLAAAAGEQTHILLSGEIPPTSLSLPTKFFQGNPHDHFGANSRLAEAPNWPGGTQGDTTLAGGNVAGGGGAHNNMQPYLILNWIIKT